ncbi:MAG: hypothetical protein NTU94_02475 [Planctomycetota bacterium]|nr:hypothetical protein [Planctomycetota bacterium]
MSRRILIVDDDPDFLAQLSTHVQAWRRPARSSPAPGPISRSWT